DRELRELEGGAHVEVERLLHRLDAGLEQRPGRGAADVVHDDVDPAELGGGGVDQRPHGIEVAEVALHGDGPAAERLDLGAHRRQRLGGAGGDDDVGADLGEGCRGTSTDATAGTRDDGD